MKTLFIPAQSNAIMNFSASAFSQLPENIAIVYSIQFKRQAQKIKELIKPNRKITFFSQILGCSVLKFPKTTQAVLLVGSGKFHALSLATQTALPIYLFEGGKIKELSEQRIQNFQKKQKASYMNFLKEEEVGILVSTKPGQQHLKRALEFKEKTKKKSYLFLCNNIDTKEFQNFGLHSWVNTACPRLELDDSSIINLNFLNKNNQN